MTNPSLPSIDDIKHRYPIETVAEKLIKNSSLKRVSDYFKTLCPFHEENTPSFIIWPDSGTWHCFGRCDIGGDVIDLVGYNEFGTQWDSHNKEQFKRALQILDGGSYTSYSSLSSERKIKPRKKRVLAPRERAVIELAARIYHTTLIEMGTSNGTPWSYLRGRNIDASLIRREGLGYASGGGFLAAALTSYGISRDEAADAGLLNRDHNYRERMAGRIIFADRDRYGNPVHLIGRTFDDFIPKDAPKYLALKDIDKPLYGYARLDRRQSDIPILVMESPPDRLTARQWGYDSVATFGTGLKAEHAITLSRILRPKIIVPHNDTNNAGLSAALKWKDSIGTLTELAILPSQYDDLNDMGQNDENSLVFAEIINHTLNKMNLPAMAEPIDNEPSKRKWTLWNIG